MQPQDGVDGGVIACAAVRSEGCSTDNRLHLVGVIEIIAGVLTLARPRAGGLVVMAWLFAIAFQLVAMGQFFDVAVRDFAMAIGALTLAQLTPFAMPREESVHP